MDLINCDDNNQKNRIDYERNRKKEISNKKIQKL